MGKLLLVRNLCIAQLACRMNLAAALSDTNRKHFLILWSLLSLYICVALLYDLYICAAWILATAVMLHVLHGCFKLVTRAVWDCFPKNNGHVKDTRRQLRISKPFRILHIPFRLSGVHSVPGIPGFVPTLQNLRFTEKDEIMYSS
jgi:hypothetical protein